MTQTLKPLRRIPLSALPSLPSPSTKIFTDSHLHHFQRSRGYADYLLFLRRLNESVVHQFLPIPDDHIYSEGVRKFMEMLGTFDSWIDEIPALETPQRFGNLAFREWGKRLEERAPSVLQTLLSPFASDSQATLIVQHLLPHLLASFGNPTRLDYGTGHETSFLLLLLSLSLIDYFLPSDERDLVLTIFTRYTELCWRLQDTYSLEPAGSHGVWGLDDYVFIGYIFGSAQLRDNLHIPPSSILSPPPLLPNNLYNLNINRIHNVKRGPFWEHSAQLYGIASGVASWTKVNSGLIKMYEAEVLGKRVVVQHLSLGGLVDWESTIPSEENEGEKNGENLTTSTPAPRSKGTSGTSIPTPAPWSSMRMPPPDGRS